MPSSPYKHEHEARQWITKILDNLIIKETKINYKMFVKQVIDNFPVSTKMVLNYINTYYIEERLLIIKGSMLTVNKEGVKDGGKSSKS